MKRPNRFLYFILVSLLKILAFFKGQKIIQKTKIKGPVITLTNHCSFYDFLYTMAAIYPHRVTYMAAKKFFYEKPLGPILKLAHAIPKALLEPDASATINGLRTLKKGGILSIFPEGQISITGVLLEISFSIAKLIKKAEVPVYIVKHYNAYLSNPPFNQLSYGGRVDTKMSLLLSVEMINASSEEEIYQLINEQLYHNPFAYNRIKRYKYRKKPLSNLDLIIYECPSCHKETIKVINRSILCTSCQYEATIDEYWQLPSTSIYELYENQRLSLKKRLESDPAFSLIAPVVLQSFRNDKLVEVGKGELKLSKEGYVYTGSIDAQPVTHKFNPKNIPSLPGDVGKNIQIYEQGQIYQFCFDNPKLPVKFILFGEILYKMALN